MAYSKRYNVFDHSPGHTSPRATPPESRHFYTLTQQWHQHSAFNHLKNRVDFFLHLKHFRKIKFQANTRLQHYTILQEQRSNTTSTMSLQTKSLIYRNTNYSYLRSKHLFNGS